MARGADLDWIIRERQIFLESYTRGLWKLLVALETRLSWGLDVSWAWGIKDPRELEGFGPGLKVLGDVKGSAGPIISVAING